MSYYNYDVNNVGMLTYEWKQLSDKSGGGDDGDGGGGGDGGGDVT